MSGRTGTNVVPMNAAAAPASAPAQSFYPAQLPFPYPGMWGGGGMPAGCCPPGGMDQLLQCYCDIQAATAFISKVVTDLAANDPAFQKALVDAIAASGSNIPLIGVTNGADAQPGQVGEFVRFQQTVSILGTAQTQSVTFGVLQPGDWDCWMFAGPQGWTADIQIYLNPVPAGFSDGGYAILGDMGPVPIAAVGMTARGLISVPTLIVMTLTTNNSGPGSGNSICNCIFSARRRR